MKDNTALYREWMKQYPLQSSDEYLDSLKPVLTQVIYDSMVSKEVVTDVSKLVKRAIDEYEYQISFEAFCSKRP